MNVQDFIKDMPKIELHRHLSGALSSSAMYAIATEKGFNLNGADLETFKKTTSMYGEDPDFHTFLNKFIARANFINDRAFIGEIVKHVVREAYEDNIIHFELRFSADHFARHMGFDPKEITEQIISISKEEAAKYGMDIVFIMTLSRHIPHKVNRTLLDIALKSEWAGYFAGIDIAGDEVNYPLKEVSEFVQEAVREGKKVTIHAGEAGPASNVDEAIEAGAVRIGHGVKSFKNRKVLEKAINRGITFEVCPTSNIQTGTVGSILDLDIKEVMIKGARISINTDDPGVSDTNLTKEYIKIQELLSLSQSDIQNLLLNAAEGAFIEDSAKEDLKKRIKGYFDGHSGGI